LQLDEHCLSLLETRHTCLDSSKAWPSRLPREARAIAPVGCGPFAKPGRARSPPRHPVRRAWRGRAPLIDTVRLQRSARCCGCRSRAHDQSPLAPPRVRRTNSRISPSSFEKTSTGSLTCARSGELSSQALACRNGLARPCGGLSGKSEGDCARGGGMMSAGAAIIPLVLSQYQYIDLPFAIIVFATGTVLLVGGLWVLVRKG
jgi:hypothetical protein